MVLLFLEPRFPLHLVFLCTLTDLLLSQGFVYSLTGMYVNTDLYLFIYLRIYLYLLMFLIPSSCSWWWVVECLCGVYVCVCV